MNINKILFLTVFVFCTTFITEIFANTPSSRSAISSQRSITTNAIAQTSIPTQQPAVSQDAIIRVSEITIKIDSRIAKSKVDKEEIIRTIVENSAIDSENSCLKEFSSCTKGFCGDKYQNCIGKSDKFVSEKVSTCVTRFKCDNIMPTQMMGILLNDMKNLAVNNAIEQKVKCRIQIFQCLEGVCGPSMTNCMKRGIQDKRVACQQEISLCEKVNPGAWSQAQAIFNAMVDSQKQRLSTLYAEKEAINTQLSNSCANQGGAYGNNNQTCTAEVKFFSKGKLAGQKRVLMGTQFYCNQNVFGVDVIGMKEQVNQRNTDIAQIQSSMIGMSTGMVAGKSGMFSGLLPSGDKNTNKEKATDKGNILKSVKGEM
ncbi:MAG: hypothetical protein JJV93_03000 [Alphaproteobacteria bacterium]|nr:hypothetical protein [Alphaproteobacteria bacterium]